MEWCSVFGWANVCLSNVCLVDRTCVRFVGVTYFTQKGLAIVARFVYLGSCQGNTLTERDTMEKVSVADLPVGLTIRYEPWSDRRLTIERVTHHKVVGVVHIEGHDPETGEALTLRFLDRIEFCL